MSEVDLSTLSGPELRGLLDSARSRGQAAEAYQILQELADRRARGDEGRGRKAARSPHVIAMNLGDPLEPDEDPSIAEAPAAPEADPPLALDSELTMRRESRPARKARKPKRRAAEPVDRREEPKRRAWPAVGFAAGIALGVTLGFGIARETLSQAAAGTATIFPAAPMLRSGEVTPAPPPPADAAPAPAPAPAVTPTEPVAGAPAPATAADAAPAAVEPPPPPPTETAAAPETAAVETVASETPPAPKPCAGAATPADRAICADPALQRLQGELRRAYAEALDAHADRALLRQHQLAWREARNDITDPAELARLYEARVRKLNAAAAEARRERDGR